MVHIKTYMFYHFYYQYLVLLTMAPRNSNSRDTRRRLHISGGFINQLVGHTAVPKRGETLLVVRYVSRPGRLAEVLMLSIWVVLKLVYLSKKLSLANLVSSQLVIRYIQIYIAKTMQCKGMSEYWGKKESGFSAQHY